MLCISNVCSLRGLLSPLLPPQYPYFHLGTPSYYPFFRSPLEPNQLPISLPPSPPSSQNLAESSFTSASSALYLGHYVMLQRPPTSVAIMSGPFVVHLAPFPRCPLLPHLLQVCPTASNRGSRA